MFEHDYTMSKHFTRKADTENSFFEWKKKVGIDPNAFPYEAVSTGFFKNKPIVFRVQSWGSYQASSGAWIVFIAYRFNAMKHTVQYAWTAAADGLCYGEPRKSEWIN